MICQYFEKIDIVDLFFENFRDFIENLQEKMIEEKENIFTLKKNKENFKIMLDNKCKEIEKITNKKSIFSFENLELSKRVFVSYPFGELLAPP